MDPMKGFDCIEMKRKAQAQLRSDYAGLSDEEERNRMIHELETSDDLAAQKWRAIRKHQKEKLLVSIETCK